VPAGHRLVITAGQLGIGLDERIPADSEGQANICLANIAAILAEDGMTMANIIRLSVYVTAREHMEGYRRARDRNFPGTPPTTTLIMVAGLVRPEFLIEIEAIAAAAAP
jgi:2-iminobutanoate/2-iminopropanoate deaminase